MERKLVLHPSGISTTVNEGETILQAAQKVGFNIEASCGGKKVCGKCRIQILEGFYESYGINSSIHSVTGVTETERSFFSETELNNHFRLACFTRVLSDVVLTIPEDSISKDAVILETSEEKTVALKPAVKNYRIELSKPTLLDHQDDAGRLRDTLIQQFNELHSDLEIDYHVLKQLPTVLRNGNFNVTVSILGNQKIIRVVEGKDLKNYGIAVDVGTTTVVTYLVDLDTGKHLQSASMMNPQIRYGDDVITRISYCNQNKDGLETLQKLIINGLNSLIQELAEKEGIEGSDIVEGVIVFNTVMGHILLGIPPEYLGKSPFALAVSEAMNIPAERLGLHILPTGNIHILPSEAGFIGADNVAVLIAEEPYQQEKLKLIIDIGTNSEICLGNQHRMLVTSCATGPAFEGAQIKCGMRAAKGAIEAVKIHPITLEPILKIIGNVSRPIGICGSGILDAVSQMAQTGMIEPDGRFSKVPDSTFLRKDEAGKLEYVLYHKRGDSERDIVVTQKDVRAIQLAKAALYAGAKSLMNVMGVKQVDEIILAGAFGSYIDKKNALSLGLFPDCHLDNVKVVGNAAGLGARLALLNTDKREEAVQVSRMTEFIETATSSEYQRLFSDAMAIPHANHCFHMNQTHIWTCGGEDRRVMSQEAMTLGYDGFLNTDLMEGAIISNSRAEGKNIFTFPLMQNLEAVIYGAKPKLIQGNYVISEYPFQAIEDIDFTVSIIESPMIQSMLECISRLPEDRKILEVQGPFSILAKLINPAKLFMLQRKNKEVLLTALDQIVNSLAEYTIACIQKGMQIISYADPEGVAELLGVKAYKEISGAATVSYLKKIEPYLHQAVVHLCGKTSYSLQKAGYINTKVYRVQKDLTYIEMLFQLAGNKKVKYIGHNCIHTDHLSIPIIHKIEWASE